LGNAGEKERGQKEMGGNAENLWQREKTSEMVYGNKEHER